MAVPGSFCSAAALSPPAGPCGMPSSALVEASFNGSGLAVPCRLRSRSVIGVNVYQEGPGKRGYRPGCKRMLSSERRIRLPRVRESSLGALSVYAMPATETTTNSPMIDSVHPSRAVPVSDHGPGGLAGGD
jgi:hypothetical protein